jgi:thioredoxin-like negative regulator of GroEL
MARADRRRAQRTRPAAVTRRPDVVIEDTMFFPRLRRHAKWMFLFLALAFALGFVAFGVGAGGVGVGDIFRGSGGGGVPSISDAEKRTLENPKDAQAFRDLATAHAATGNTDEAIQALESLVSLRPKDADALRQLAAQYLQKLDDAQQRARIGQIREAYLAPGIAVASALQLGSTPLDPDPISSAISTAVTAESSMSFGEAQQAASQYVDTYRRLAATDPKDASLQLEYAQQAESVGDTTAAVAGYRAFLAIPNIDPAQRADVKLRLKQLSQVTTG